MSKTTRVDFEDEEKQLVLLALAVLSLRSPGFWFATREIAKKLDGEVYYHEFLKVRAPEDAKTNDTDEAFSDSARRRHIADLIVRVRMWANEESTKVGREYERDAMLRVANEAERVAKGCWLGFDPEKDCPLGARFKRT